MENMHLTTETHFYGSPLEEAKAIVILLHGRRQEINQVSKLSERIGLSEICYILPVAYEQTWYPHGFMAPITKNQPHLDHALEYIEQIISMLRVKEIPREKIAIMGFSQGACLAVEYTLRNPEQISGLISFTGGAFGSDNDNITTPKLKNLNMFILLSIKDADSWVPLDRVVKTAEIFKSCNVDVNLRIYSGAEHNVSDDEIHEAKILLEKMIQGAVN